MAIRDLDDVYSALDDLNDILNKQRYGFSEKMNAIIEFTDNLDDIVGAVDKSRDIIAELEKKVDELNKEVWRG